MGTHPIFESDFDCLTDLESRRIMAKRTRKVVLLVSTARGTALRCERSSRRWKFLNIRNTNLPSAARLLLNEQLSASGPAHAPTKMAGGAWEPHTQNYQVVAMGIRRLREAVES